MRARRRRPDLESEGPACQLQAIAIKIALDRSTLPFPVSVDPTAYDQTVFLRRTAARPRRPRPNTDRVAGSGTEVERVDQFTVP